MKASKNSLHAKMYEFTYTSYLPQNLCPYFWKLVWAIIILIPNFIIRFPALIINVFTKVSDDCVERRKFGFAIYFILAILFLYLLPTINWIKAIFNFYSYNREYAIMGGGINSIIFIVCSFFLIKHFINKKPKRIVEEKQPSIVIEFIKAKYNRYCPKIEWETDKTKQI